MDESTATAEAGRIMVDFVERTGVVGTESAPQRYLWTDAYALCNLLSLYERTGDDEFRRLAVALIDQVHDVLGRHRDDDPRTGWISGLDEDTGREHPTTGGLRIGKQLNERGRDEAFDDRLEWDRDGQYFHYLTKWMHALRRAGEVLDKARYCRWAIELAQAAHAGFRLTYPPGESKRLVWKMSIDLSYPLVPSTGQHDPLDAWVTYQALGLCMGRFQAAADLPGLDSEIAESAAMLGPRHWHTDDALGIGGLLFDACRVLQLLAAGRRVGQTIAEDLTRASLESLESFIAQKRLSDPPEYRLAFRELGLAIGLRAVPRMRGILDNEAGLAGSSLQKAVTGLADYVALADELETFWLRRDHQRTRTWKDHCDINDVMLATSLVPDQFLSA
jgi:hypothetical protein